MSAGGHCDAATGNVGILDQHSAAQMHHPVMVRTQQDKIVDIGRPRIAPVDDMVGVASTRGTGAATEHATSVPDRQRGALGGGREPRRHPHRDRFPADPGCLRDHQSHRALAHRHVERGQPDRQTAGIPRRPDTVHPVGVGHDHHRRQAPSSRHPRRRRRSPRSRPPGADRRYGGQPIRAGPRTPPVPRSAAPRPPAAGAHRRPTSRRGSPRHSGAVGRRRPADRRRAPAGPAGPRSGRPQPGPWRGIRPVPPPAATVRPLRGAQPAPSCAPGESPPHAHTRSPPPAAPPTRPGTSAATRGQCAPSPGPDPRSAAVHR